MSIKAVLFDMDGTLLPMDNDAFTRDYVRTIADVAEGWGYIREELIEALWKATGKMMANDQPGNINMDLFWKYFTPYISNKSHEEVIKDIPLFDQFYTKEFHQVKPCTWENPRARAMLSAARKGGKRVILATSPIFPKVAILARLSWTGLREEDFDYITSYENCCYTKPNPKYYTEILEKNGLRADECVLVGNNIDEDAVPAESVGIRTIICTDCLINRHDLPIEPYTHGTFEEMIKEVEKL